MVTGREGTWLVRLPHGRLKTPASFDDLNLVRRAGLVPVMGLGERAGLSALARERVRVGGPCGVNAGAMFGCLAAGMAGGADSAGDMGVLRHGAMTNLSDGVRARSALVWLLRSWTWGSVAWLGRAGRLLLAGPPRGPAARRGGPGVRRRGLDPRRVHGPARQGAPFGHAKRSRRSGRDSRSPPC